MRTIINRWHVALRILCAAALFAIGFAHAPIALAGQVTASELGAYALPDGSLPELCLPGKDGSADGKLHLMHGCEACLIGAALLMPAPADTAGIPFRVETRTYGVVHAESAYRQLFPPNTSPRGPPARQLVI